MNEFEPTEAADRLSPDASLHASGAQATPTQQAECARLTGYFTRGHTIFNGGERGDPWRVAAGVVRLSRNTPAGPEFGGLARAGDVIGAETLMFGCYTYTAVALSPVMLEPWLTTASPDRERGLLVALAAAERRVSEVLALRGGRAIERIARLFGLLAGGATAAPEQSVVIPRLKDIAEMTDLKVETVSRTITQMSESGALVMQDKRRARLTINPDSALQG